MYTGFGSIGLPIGRYVIYYTITKAQVTLQIKVARLQLFPSAHLRHLRFAGLWWALGRQTKIKGSKMEVANFASREAHTALADHIVLTVCLLRARYHVGVKART